MQYKRHIGVIAAFVLGSVAISMMPTHAEPDAPIKLQGGVVKVGDGLNDLRDARLSVSRVRKAVANLYDEVTRQQVVMNYNPNIIGTTVISIPSPSFTGQLLPARPKWVKAAMEEIGPQIALFKEDVDIAIESDRQIDASEPTREALAPLRDEAFKSVNQSFNLYKQLEGLTSGSSYDNSSIAQVAQSLDKELKVMDKSLKKGVSILQKEAKAAKKSQKTA
jgi:hypothetical protein